MATTPAPKRKPAPKPAGGPPKRTKTKKVPNVTFDLPGWDSPWSLPSLDKLTQRQQWAMASGDISRLASDVVGSDYAELIQDMDDDEINELMEAWREASGVEPGE